MTGARIEFDHREALAVINQTIAAIEDPEPMFRDWGEYLLYAHRQRFQQQTSPEGAAWQALSPRYLKRKKKNRDKILRLDGRLSSDLAYKVSDTEFLFGSNEPYAAIHHFGGTIDMPARRQQAYFKQAKDGTIGNRFVKKTKSNFAQSITIGAHKITMPARPWLGVSAQDEAMLLGLTRRYLDKVIGSL